MRPLLMVMLVCSASVAAGCSQGVGGRCVQDSDCSSGLLCVGAVQSAEGGRCMSTSTVTGFDAATATGGQGGGAAGAGGAAAGGHGGAAGAGGAAAGGHGGAPLTSDAAVDATAATDALRSDAGRDARD